MSVEFVENEATCFGLADLCFCVLCLVVVVVVGAFFQHGCGPVPPLVVDLKK